MPELPKNARHGTTDAKELVRPLRDLHQYVSGLPEIELLTFEDRALRFPIDIPTTVQNPRALVLSVRSFPDDGTDVGSSLPTWRFVADQGVIRIIGITGLTSVSGYTLDIVVFGSRE